MRILVVDDTQLMRSILVEWLTAFGHQIVLACDGAEGLEVVNTQSQPFDMVIADWEMPKVTGPELCWAIRARGDSHYPYILVITASEQVEKYTEALDSGADDLLRKPLSRAMLWARLRAGERFLGMQRELVRLATTDGLTGTLNRRHFLCLAAEAVARSGSHDMPLTVLMLDIDKFKRINDSHGHDVGDRALVAFVSACRGVVGEVGVLGRLGGEEFAVLLPGVFPGAALTLAEKVRRAVAALSLPLRDDEALGFTVSIGIGALAQGEGDIAPALKRADIGLYRAKQAGRNRIRYERA